MPPLPQGKGGDIGQHLPAKGLHARLFGRELALRQHRTQKPKNQGQAVIRRLFKRPQRGIEVAGRDRDRVVSVAAAVPAQGGAAPFGTSDTTRKVTAATPTMTATPSMTARTTARSLPTWLSSMPTQMAWAMPATPMMITMGSWTARTTAL